MGFRKDWDTNAIKHWLWAMAHDCSNPRNDGFTQFEIKKELLEIKFLVDDLVSNTPKFVGEEDIHYDRLMKKLK